MKCKNIWTTDINVDGKKVIMGEEIEVSTDFSKTIECQNLLRHKYLEEIKTNKKEIKAKLSNS